MLAFPVVVGGAAPEQSVSSSRQFIVYGTEIRVRGAICDLAERTKRDLLNLLDQRDAWGTPIIINAQYPQANLPELPRLAVNLSQTGFGLKLQVDLTIDAEISGPKVRREILRALLLEMIYRGESSIPAGAIYVSPPDWLLDGVPAEQSDVPLERVSNLLSLPVAARTMMPLEKLLQQKPELLDAPGRLLYRAYAIALLDLLRGAPEGPARLTRLIVGLRSASNDSLAELRNHFPQIFPGGHGAEKIWERQVARLAAIPSYQLLTGAETGRRLNDALRLEFPERGGEKSYDLAEFPKFRKHPSADRVLARLAHDLGQLEIRANPIYRPIISDYAKVTALLTRGKTKGFASRLESLRAARQAVAKQMREIDDYLNWFEATQLRGPSGAFADYLKAADSAAEPPKAKRDPISIYLDAVQTHFEN
jgi:hypothetical protein